MTYAIALWCITSFDARISVFLLIFGESVFILPFVPRLRGKTAFRRNLVVAVLTFSPMAMHVRLTVMFESLGESLFAGYVPDRPEIPQVIGQGVAQAKRRLEQQIQRHFATNFLGQTFYIDRTLLFFFTSNQGPTSTSRPA
ncbi:MAG: hypothetical protein H7Z75_03455 [Ferruginibacter sp.]|nr:hypothetical protein [Cytophagales bacterium]